LLRGTLRGLVQLSKLMYVLDATPIEHFVNPQRLVQVPGPLARSKIRVKARRCVFTDN
jgi:hypothetical protein